MTLLPLPDNQGVGFFTTNEVDPLNPQFKGFKYAKIGIYHNFYATTAAWKFPTQQLVPIENIIFDGFSPNLNKSLHVGHLRNLALATAFCHTAKSIHRLQVKPVALLGASLGVNSKALEEFNTWSKLAQYEPDIYHDVLLPYDLFPQSELQDGINEQFGCKVWNGPFGPVIVEKSNGSKTYAYYDIIFARLVKPHFYITGAEQKEHFKSLNLEDNHIPMGLVLGIDGKKIKSRDGGAFLAIDVLNEIKKNLKQTEQPDQLAWNIIAWNMLSVSRNKNIQFNPEVWCDANSPGLYISYTFARISKALHSALAFASVDWSTRMLRPTARPTYLQTELDIELAGFSSYCDYYIQRAVIQKDPNCIANFALKLAMKLNTAYANERIVDGRDGHLSAITISVQTLERCMKCLSMYPIYKV